MCVYVLFTHICTRRTHTSEHTSTRTNKYTAIYPNTCTHTYTHELTHTHTHTHTPHIHLHLHTRVSFFLAHLGPSGGDGLHLRELIQNFLLEQRFTGGAGTSRQASDW